MTWLRRVWNAILNRPLPAPVAAEKPAPMRISPAALWEAQRGGTPVPSGEMIFAPYKPAPGVMPSGMAMDALPITPAAQAAIVSYAAQEDYHEGLRFFGYPYLAELAQRPEYRKMAEKWAEHATRKWVKITGDNEKVAAIHAELDRLNVRMTFREAFEHDGLFGRAQIFLDFGKGGKSDADDPIELQSALVINPSKVNQKRPLKAIKAVEPIWSAPQRYNTSNPLAPDFYQPLAWLVYGNEVSATRMLTMVGREVPDLLKPAYSFGGLSMTQMAKPYVDNWLRTRQSVSDLVNAFSNMVLATDMAQRLREDSNGGTLFDRVDAFNGLRSNRGTMVIDKDTEELTNVTVPLSGLDKLQAQAQEQMASVSSMPLLILLGVTPSGLNASGEGELRTFYTDVKAYQEKVARQPFQTILDLVQLSLFDAIDDGIKFEFEDLWEMSDADKALIRKADAECDALYEQAGAIDADDIRDRINEDESNIYHGRLKGPAPDDPDDEEEGTESEKLLKAA